MRLTGDSRVSLLMVALWGAAPGSTVFSMLYPETLYCALAIWALVALTSRRWLMAAVLTIAAGTVQSEAVALVTAVMVAALCSLIPAVRSGQPAAELWRRLAALALAPLGLVAYLGFVAVRIRRLDGWFWIESAAWHQSFDWGLGVTQNLEQTTLGWSSVASTLLVLIIVLIVPLTAWSIDRSLPVYLNVYTLVAVSLALGTSGTWFSSMLRFVLPAVLLALPLARSLARLRTLLLVPLTGVLAVASTWFGLYLTVIARLPP
jgi:hypothetical protein